MGSGLIDDCAWFNCFITDSMVWFDSTMFITTLGLESVRFNLTIHTNLEWVTRSGPAVLISISNDV